MTTHTRIDEAKMFSAIDIGSTKVVALSGYRNERGEITVAGHGVVNSTNLDIDKEKEHLNIENIRTAILAAVEAARQEAGFFCKKVVVGAAGRFMRSATNRIDFMRPLPFDPITEKEIDQQFTQNISNLVEYNEKIFHVKILNYTVDEEFYSDAPVGKTGSSVSMSVCVIKIKSDYLQQLRLLMEQCEMEVAEFMLEPLASSAAVVTENERKAGCTLVDMGGGTTDVAIYENGNLRFAEVIPLAGNCITNDIRQNHIKGLDGGEIHYNTEDWRIAEQIKIKCGRCMVDEDTKERKFEVKTANQGILKFSFYEIAHTIQARMDEIVAAVHSMVRSTEYPTATQRGIILTGGGAELKDIAYFFEQKLHCPVRVAEPNQVGVRSKTFDCSSPRYATVVGLLMRAAELHATTYVPPVETPKVAVVENHSAPTHSAPTHSAPTPPVQAPPAQTKTTVVAQAPVVTQAPVAPEAPKAEPKVTAKAEPKPVIPQVTTPPPAPVEKKKRESVLKIMSARVGKAVNEFAGAVFADTQEDTSKDSN